MPETSATRKKKAFLWRMKSHLEQSAFVAVRNGQCILTGKMMYPDNWVERFFVGQQQAPTYSQSGKYMITTST